MFLMIAIGAACFAIGVSVGSWAARREHGPEKVRNFALGLVHMKGPEAAIKEVQEHYDATRTVDDAQFWTDVALEIRQHVERQRLLGQASELDL